MHLFAQCLTHLACKLCAVSLIKLKTILEPQQKAEEEEEEEEGTRQTTGQELRTWKPTRYAN